MTFFTVINCMDGRVQLPVFAYLKDRFKVDFIDVITEAGPVGVLARHSKAAEAKSIFRRTEVSIHAHNTTGIAIAAHYDCAGNPVPEEIQKQQLQVCRDLLKQRYPQLEVLSLWVDENWTVSPQPD